MATGYSVMDALNKNSKAGIDSSPRARFRTKDISIHKIYSNSMNFYPQEGIEEKAGEILSIGLLEGLAVKYEPCEKGEYKLISGERRWRALNLLVDKGYKEFEMVTCQVRSPQNEHEEIIEIIIANSSRTKTVMTKIQEEQKLKEELEYMKEHNIKLKGYDLQKGRLRDVIADMLKMSKTKVAQIEAVNNNLIPEWKEELKGERLTFSAAYELSGMTQEQQRDALGKFQETGELTHKDVKSMKEAKATGQQSPLSYHGEIIGEKEADVSECDTASGEYQTPHPEGITSICYSCTEYETCNVKTATCTKCDQYRNRTETYKTDEQRYSEEQDNIDRDTKKKLREMKEEEEAQKPVENPWNEKKTVRVSSSKFTEYAENGKTYMIVKDEKFKIGNILVLMVFADGRATGETMEMRIYCKDDSSTSSALEDGWCVLGLENI